MGDSRRNSQRGGSKLNLVMTLAIMVAIVMAGWKMVPPYIANYQLQDALQDESRFALTGYPKKTDSDIRDDVAKKAKDLGIALKPDDVKVSVVSGEVDISLDYSVPVDLLVYQFALSFHPHADNHTL